MRVWIHPSPIQSVNDRKEVVHHHLSCHVVFNIQKFENFHEKHYKHKGAKKGKMGMMKIIMDGRSEFVFIPFMWWYKKNIARKIKESRWEKTDIYKKKYKIYKWIESKIHCFCWKPENIVFVESILIWIFPGQVISDISFFAHRFCHGLLHGF